MATKSLRELLVTKIKGLYDIESELIEALPKMAEAATDEDLKSAFREHLEETRVQAKRLEDIFDILGEEKDKMKLDAIRGLVSDGESLMSDAEDGDSRDAVLIASARAVEHYEMAEYMGAQEWAEMLGEEEVAPLLQENLYEEEKAEEKLAELGALITERITPDTEKED